MGKDGRVSYEEITLDQYRTLAKKRSKYNNVQTHEDGYTFDSKVEAARYRKLKLRVAAGEISDLVVHPTYELQPAFAMPGDSRRKFQAITYEGDFAYTEDGRKVCEDVKGFVTDVFKIKRKMFLFRYPDIELLIIPAEGKPIRSRKRAA
jgi:hypothetical protein